jgi:hypothetical protein
MLFVGKPVQQTKRRVYAIVHYSGSKKSTKFTSCLHAKKRCLHFIINLHVNISHDHIQNITTELCKTPSNCSLLYSWPIAIVDIARIYRNYPQRLDAS